MSSYTQPDPAATEAAAATEPRWREWLASEAACSARELMVLCVTAALLLFYGLVPLRIGHATISAPKIGLVGADEPRYAQIAAEMLEEHSHDLP